MQQKKQDQSTPIFVRYMHEHLSKYAFKGSKIKLLCDKTTLNAILLIVCLTFFRLLYYINPLDTKWWQ